MNVPEHLMLDLETEIQRPTGIWTIKPPKLSISGLLISKECGIMYEVTKTDGLRQGTKMLMFATSNKHIDPEHSSAK